MLGDWGNLLLLVDPEANWEEGEKNMKPFTFLFDSYWS